MIFFFCMALIFPTEEDRLKSNAGLNVDSDLEVSEYTRECMKEYERVCYNQDKKSGLKKSFSLEEGLINLAFLRKEVGDDFKRKIDKKALWLIKRGCKKNSRAIREYYRVYWNLKRGVFYIDGM